MGVLQFLQNGDIGFRFMYVMDGCVKVGFL